MSQMDWKVVMPPGAACYVNVDGSLQFRFDSSRVDDVVKWARDWVLLFEHYANAHRSGGTHANLGPLPKTPAEIQLYVDKLNSVLKMEREGSQPFVAKTVTMEIPASDPVSPKKTELVQCPKCMGMRVAGPADDVCDRCQGAGAISS